MAAPAPARRSRGASCPSRTASTRRARRRSIATTRARPSGPRFQRWSDVICPSGRRTSLRFKEEEDIAAAIPANPHARGSQHFGIYFRDDTWTAKDADSTLALTTQSFGLVNGYVDQSDIEINTTTENFATSDSAKGIDLEAVLTHEVGHYIGFAHSKDPDSIMVLRYCESGERCGQAKTDARRLSDDDRDAVCSLFPPSGPAGVTYEDPNAASCSAAPSGAGTSSRSTWLPLAGAAFVVAALRRARRALFGHVITHIVTDDAREAGDHGVHAGAAREGDGVAACAIAAGVDERIGGLFDTSELGERTDGWDHAMREPCDRRARLSRDGHALDPPDGDGIAERRCEERPDLATASSR